MLAINSSCGSTIVNTSISNSSISSGINTLGWPSSPAHLGNGDQRRSTHSGKQHHWHSKGSAHYTWQHAVPLLPHLLKLPLIIVDCTARSSNAAGFISNFPASQLPHWHLAKSQKREYWTRASREGRPERQLDSFHTRTEDGEHAGATDDKSEPCENKKANRIRQQMSKGQGSVLPVEDDGQLLTRAADADVDKELRGK